MFYHERVISMAAKPKFREPVMTVEASPEWARKGRTKAEVLAKVRIMQARNALQKCVDERLANG